jgi:hypothetical protein
MGLYERLPTTRSTKYRQSLFNLNSDNSILSILIISDFTTLVLANRLIRLGLKIALDRSISSPSSD